MRRCENETRHTGRYCGSYAVNDDPEKKLCDVCYAHRAGLEEGRGRVAELEESCRRHVERVERARAKLEECQRINERLQAAGCGVARNGHEGCGDDSR